MAVEKMHLVNITSRLENLKDLLKDVISLGQIEPIDAFNQVASRAFSVEATSENVEITEDINNITSFESLSSEEINKLIKLKDFFKEMGSDFKENHRVIDLDKLDMVYDRLEPLILKRQDLVEKRSKLINYKENLEILNSQQVDIKSLNSLEYFEYRFGDVSKDGRFVLKNNYDNIPSLIIHLKEDGKEDLNSEALAEIIKIDQKTKDRRNKTNDIIKNEREESQAVLSDIEDRYRAYVANSIEKIDRDYKELIDSKSMSLKKDYDKKKDHISKLYESKLDGLIEEAFESIIGGGSIE